MNQIFVYGTLRQETRHQLNLKFKDWGKPKHAYIYGDLMDLGAYPGLIINPSGKKVYGELYILPDDYSFDELDKYEDYFPDHPEKSEFMRERETVYLGEQNRVLAWVYIYNPSILFYGLITLTQKVSRPGR